MKFVTTSVALGLAVIVAFWIAASATKYCQNRGETIVVIVLLKKILSVTLLFRTGSYSRKSLDLKNAYAALKQDESTIRQSLQRKGVSDHEMIFTSVEINKEFSTRTDANGRQPSQEFTGYNLTQVVKVKLVNVDKVEKISREVTELIESEIEFNSLPPAYHYSNYQM